MDYKHPVILGASIEFLMSHPVAGGHSHGSSRRTRTKVVALRPDDSQQERPEGRVPRWRVLGLSDGEEDFYSLRDGRALAVLKELAARLARNDEPAERTEPYAATRGSLNFSVYGLTAIEIRLLRTAPGAARSALVDVARAEGGARVAAVDRGAEAKAERRRANRRRLAA